MQYKKTGSNKSCLSPKDRNITKTCLYNSDPLKPHFYIVKLRFTGVYITFIISAQKHRLWVLIRTASLKLQLFRTNFHGPKGVRAIEVRLYMVTLRLMTLILCRAEVQSINSS